MTGREIIDWARVDALREEIGESDFCEVAGIFMEESDSVIGRLETAPDPACYEADLHFLKGSALNLGFAGLASLCQQGERAAAQGAADKVDIGAVIRLYRQSVAAFGARPQHPRRRSSAA